MRELLRLTRLLRPHAGRLALAVAAALLAQSLTVATAAASAGLVGWAAAGEAARVRGGLGLVVALVVAGAAAAWLRLWLGYDLAYRVHTDLRLRIYDAFARLAPTVLVERRGGEMAAMALADVTRLEWFYARLIPTAAAAVVVPAAALAVLAAIHPLPALVLAPLVALAGAVPWFLGRRAARQGSALRRAFAEVNAEVAEGVQGLREIVLFGRGGDWLARLSQSSRALVAGQLAYGARAGLESAATGLLTLGGMLAVLAAAAALSGRGELRPDLLPVCLILAATVFTPVLAATAAASRLGLVLASAERVFEVLEKPAPVDDRAAAPAGDISFHLRFEGVAFRYPGERGDALRGVSFEVRPGETVALVGHSGAGKSTCLQLLLRFHDPSAGRITLGGRDLREISLADLRSRIALVPQEVHLFDETLAENLRLGRPEAADSEVERAAAAAHVHRVIARLPQGYGTTAGERGTQLSGGERQRVALARALLKDAPLLVLDEAVSNLDAETEQALQRSLARLRAGRTVLLVAHRLSTIRSADRIVVLERGRVAEEGTHAELLARGRVYPGLVAASGGRLRACE
jgi:ATP-binding cassette, subfamily C, bacterial CydC